MKKRLILCLFVFLILISGCNAKKDDLIENGDKELILSNMADEESFKEVESILKLNLDEKSVTEFMGFVADYNTTIENIGLNDGFVKMSQPIYDVEKTDVVWTNKKGDFVGTNCRINTFILLKRNITVNSQESNASFLFIDHEAIAMGKLLDEEELNKFNVVFSGVKTEHTKDIKVHVEKMKEHFQNIVFHEKARMISVVMHDDLDGDYLFVAHVGVLVENDKEYLFVEKLSFQEPYQAIKFSEKEDVYDYLLDKYAIDYNQDTAKPFIMDNGELAKYVE